MIIAILLAISSLAFAADEQFSDGLKLYLKGEVEQAVQIWNQMAQQGNLQAQIQLGQYYLSDGKQRDYQQAVHWYEMAASQGDKDARQYLDNARTLYNTWRTLADEIGADAAYDTLALREHLHEGDDTQCGFVIEVKNKVALIQTTSQPRWFKKDELYLPGAKGCSWSH